LRVPCQRGNRGRAHAHVRRPKLPQAARTRPDERLARLLAADRDRRRLQSPHCAYRFGTVPASPRPRACQKSVRNPQAPHLTARDGNPLSVIVADLDSFRQVNDTHGHPVGDAVLRHVSGLLRDPLRAYDSLGRYGGEEFLVVLRHAEMRVHSRWLNACGVLSLTAPRARPLVLFQ